MIVPTATPSTAFLEGIEEAGWKAGRGPGPYNRVTGWVCAQGDAEGGVAAGIRALSLLLLPLAR